MERRGRLRRIHIWMQLARVRFDKWWFFQSGVAVKITNSNVIVQRNRGQYEDANEGIEVELFV